MEIKIEQLKIQSLEITNQINNLLIQLKSNAKKLNDKDLREVIDEPSNHFFIAKETINNKVVGMVLLIINKLIDGKKGWIENLVVDKEYRRQGIATKLLNCAIDNAKSARVSSLNFTSRPEREEANKLYQRLGFEKRDTNVYRMKLSS